MRLVNLTPHAITINGHTGRVVIPPSGAVARVEPAPDPAGDDIITVDGVTVRVAGQRLGQAVGLPEPEDGVMFIVSLPVASALAGRRRDVVSPGPLVRDENGQPVACDGLVRTMA